MTYFCLLLTLINRSPAPVLSSVRTMAASSSSVSEANADGSAPPPGVAPLIAAIVLGTCLVILLLVLLVVWYFRRQKRQKGGPDVQDEEKFYGEEWEETSLETGRVVSFKEEAPRSRPSLRRGCKVPFPQKKKSVFPRISKPAPVVIRSKIIEDFLASPSSAVDPEEAHRLRQISNTLRMLEHGRQKLLDEMDKAAQKSPSFFTSPQSQKAKFRWPIISPEAPSPEIASPGSWGHSPSELNNFYFPPVNSTTSPASRFSEHDSVAIPTTSPPPVPPPSAMVRDNGGRVIPKLRLIVPSYCCPEPNTALTEVPEDRWELEIQLELLRDQLRQLDYFADPDAPAVSDAQLGNSTTEPTPSATAV